MGDLTYVSIDPGGSTSGKRTIGVVAWDESGLPLKMEQYTQEELDEFLMNLREVPTLKVIIVESYRVFSHKLEAHRNKKMETSECIGRIKFAAKLLGVKLVEQPSSILSITEKWSGVKIPSNHSKSHQFSAYLHGYHYLHRRGIIQPRVLERIQAKPSSKLDG